MTLRRKMTYQIAAMIVGLLLVGGAALWGINALHQDYGVALEGYQRLRQVYETATRLSTAQKILFLPHPQTLKMARDEVHAAARSFEELPAPEPGWDTATDAKVRESLKQAVAAVDAPPDAPAEVVADRQRDAINAVLAHMPTLIAGIRQTTAARQEAARERRRETFWTVGLLAGAVVAAGLVLGVVQYRSVMRPLGRLSEGVRRVAAGRFREKVDPRGGTEFASLAHDFNRMAAELEGFYHELEEKVAAKSKELIRSERLASVGYLAAGVAHEINNPLGIISGYAEYSLTELRDRARAARSATSVGAAAAKNSADAVAGNGAHMPTTGGTSPDGRTSIAGTALAAGASPDDEIEKSLRIICDEAFRCKEITGKLLSLARPGDDNRRPVSLADVADHVASIIGGLREFRDRRLVVHAERRDVPGELTVSAVEAEMKQVLLNLAVNALDAVAPGEGEVRIDVCRRPDDHWVELSVTDNGRGMSPQTLERVFEPFFTDKRGAPSHGTGLGLSITHAIVQGHGGTIEAHSDGVGKGSRFTVRLPAGGSG